MDGIETPVRVTLPDGTVLNASTIITFHSVPSAGIVDYGSGTVHSLMTMNEITGQSELCIQLSSNCQGTPYSYSTVSVDEGWSGTFKYNGVTYSVNVSHVEAYWDWRFFGYQKEGKVDYSQNCHGYAFGVGDCPSDGGYGASIILNEGVCYAMTDTLSAEIAMLAGNSHSIKVVGGLCINSGTGSSVIKSTSEKYRESAIYKQENQAGATVVVPINAHGFGASLGGLYKKL